MTVYCSRCLFIINESEFHIREQLKIPYTIRDGNLVCEECDKKLYKKEIEK